MTSEQPEKPTALLLLDYQVGLCESGPHCRVPGLAESIAERDVLGHAARVLDAARRAGLFVAHARLAFDASYASRTNLTPRFDAYPAEDAMLGDSPEARIVDALKPAADEPVVDKGCVDPFIGTPLLEMLIGRRVRDVLLCGVATNLVVESAARHAADSGLGVTVIEDACASFADDAHEFSMTRIMPMFAAVRAAEDVVGEL